jgi:starvation-inducible DNA-binding protein
MLLAKEREDKVVVDKLQDLLSDLHLAYSHLHNFHWNVEGPHFLEYHEHLQGMYEGVAGRIDDVAERILQIGSRPLANLAEYTKRSELQAVPSEAIHIPEIAEAVLGDLNHLIRKLYEVVEASEDCGDEATLDFAVEMLRDYEKERWFWAAIKGQ